MFLYNENSLSSKKHVFGSAQYIVSMKQKYLSKAHISCFYKTKNVFGSIWCASKNMFLFLLIKKHVSLFCPPTNIWCASKNHVSLMKNFLFVYKTKYFIETKHFCFWDIIFENKNFCASKKHVSLMKNIVFYRNNTFCFIQAKNVLSKQHKRQISFIKETCFWKRTKYLLMSESVLQGALPPTAIL